MRTRRVSRNDYGRDVLVEERDLLVTVPFEGDPSLLFMRPSRLTVLSEPVEVDTGSDVLRYAMPLDPSQEPRFNKLLETIVANLETLRQEYDAFFKAAGARLYQMALDRKSKLEADQALVQGFSFKIRNAGKT